MGALNVAVDGHRAVDLYCPPGSVVEEVQRTTAGEIGGTRDLGFVLATTFLHGHDPASARAEAGRGGKRLSGGRGDCVKRADEYVLVSLGDPVIEVDRSGIDHRAYGMEVVDGAAAVRDEVEEA
ncbi:MAG: hypothetical protein IPO67_27345 [Deltaproteobacteria bacterium]|nr:hypothetical protein [Deltaproteobacteria bacterium]